MQIELQSLLKLVFVVSCRLRQSVMYQQNTMNEKNKIFRKTYILNNMKTVILRYYGLFVAASSSWVICSRSFEEMYRIHLQIYEPIHGLTTLKMTAVRSFETSGRYCTTRRCSNRKYLLLPQYNRLQPIKRFSSVSFPAGKAATFPLN